MRDRWRSLPEVIGDSQFRLIKCVTALGKLFLAISGLSYCRGVDLAATLPYIVFQNVGQTDPVFTLLKWNVLPVEVNKLAIELVEKYFRYVIQMAQAEDAAIPVATAIHHLYRDAIARGFGNDNITGVVKLFI